MINRICQLGIVLCLVVIVGQFLLASYWERKLASSYLYDLAIVAYEEDGRLKLSDGRRISIPDDYRLGGSPFNGTHNWLIIRDEPGYNESLYIYPDPFFRGPLTIMTGLSEPAANRHCRLSGDLRVCDSESGRFRFIQELDGAHACERLTGTMDPDGGLFTEIVHIKVPSRPEFINFSGPKGSAIDHRELVLHVLDELSFKPSEQYLTACLGQLTLEI